ncbi:hypothetical protein GOBAR_DD21029 [Gossypium barbadense]|nr:hypothetical protein GOBAR_DD21029 [Gossypium barbadense]
MGRSRGNFHSADEDPTQRWKRKYELKHDNDTRHAYWLSNWPCWRPGVPSDQFVSPITVGCLESFSDKVVDLCQLLVVPGSLLLLSTVGDVGCLSSCEFEPFLGSSIARNSV